MCIKLIIIIIYWWQNNINIMSVEIKKEEKETAGIRKKAVDVKIANSRLLYNFLEIKKTT